MALRNLAIVYLRGLGATFREIGNIFGISKQAANFIYLRDKVSATTTNQPEKH